MSELTKKSVTIQLSILIKFVFAVGLGIILLHVTLLSKDSILKFIIQRLYG